MTRSGDRTSAALDWLLPPAPARDRAPLRSVSASDGHGPGSLERWCQEGGLLWLAGDVYLPLDVAATAEARRDALALLVPRGATVAMASAVWCRGGPGLPHGRPTWADSGRPRIELLVTAGCSLRATSLTVRMRQSDVGSQQVERLGPLRVTTGTRTALDLARWGAGPDDDAALAWLWEHGVTTRAAAVMARGQRRTPGVRRVRSVLAAVRHGSQAPLSSIPLEAD